MLVAVERGIVMGLTIINGSAEKDDNYASTQ
jgi:hypothetical protein